MKKLIIQEVNKINKWAIDRNIFQFISYEWCNTNSLFASIKTDSIDIHLELFFDGVDIETVVNCYGSNKEHLLSLSGSTEYCLNEIDNLKTNETVRQRLINYINSRINYFSGGEEMKSLNESIRDEIFIEELKNMKKIINDNNF